MSVQAAGRRGEEMARTWLHAHGFTDYFQPDWMVYREDCGEFILEVKYQERFEAPPFDGHGLPKRQVKKRLAFYARHDIPTLLLVFDKVTSEIFWEWLHILDAGPSHITGIKRRIVYPLPSFRCDAAT